MNPKTIVLVMTQSHKSFGGIQKYLTQVKEYNDSLGNNTDYLSAEDFFGVFHGNKRICLDPRIFNYIYKHKDSIFYLHGTCVVFLYQVALLLSLFGIRYSLMPHFHPFNTHKYPFFSKIYFKFFDKYVFKTANKVICLSDNEKQYYKNIRINPNLYLTTHGVEVYNFPNKPFSSRKYFIAYIGRLEYNKGYDRFLALDSWLKTNGLKGVIVCPEWNKSLSMPKNIDICEGVDDLELRRVLGDALFCVIPSRYEAFSYVVLESLERGTPVIASSQVQAAMSFKEEPFISIIESSVWHEAVSEYLNSLKENLDPYDYYDLSHKAFLFARRYEKTEVINQHIKLLLRTVS